MLIIIFVVIFRLKVTAQQRLQLLLRHSRQLQKQALLLQMLQLLHSQRQKLTQLMLIIILHRPRARRKAQNPSDTAPRNFPA